MNAVQQLLTDHIDIWTAAETEKKSGRGRASGSAASVYGIKKLRELILDLAVRGKLVPQDANDEPARELLERIQTERARLVAEKRTRKGQPLSPIENQEKTFDLPCGWEWVRLGLIGDWGAGTTPSRSKSSYYGGTTPWFKSGELTADFIDSSEETVTDLALQECSLRLNQPGDVLIAMYGATIGKTAVLKIAGTTNQAVCACTPNTGILNLYLLVLLKAMRSNFIDQGAGGAQPNISREKIIATVIALPPTEEQHRIVAKVDKLMALCDQMEAQHRDAATAHEQLVSHLLGTLTQSQSAAEFNANWQRIAAHFDTLFTTEATIDTLKQTLLQLAVMGKLVAQDAKDEPASELLKRIQAEKIKLIEAGKIKKDKPTLEIGCREMAFQVPEGWAWSRMINCSSQITDGEHLTPQRTSDCTQIPLVTAKNVRDGIIDYTTTDFVDIDVAKKCWNRCKPEINDILIVSVGATIGRLAIVESHCDMVIVRSVTLIKPLLIDVNYLSIALRSPLLQKQIWSGVKQNAQPGLYLSVSQSLPIPLPPLPEQRRIVAMITELMQMCEKLRSGIATAKRQHIKIANVFVERAILAQ